MQQQYRALAVTVELLESLWHYVIEVLRCIFDLRLYGYRQINCYACN